LEKEVFVFAIKNSTSCVILVMQKVKKIKKSVKKGRGSGAKMKSGKIRVKKEFVIPDY